MNSPDQINNPSNSSGYTEFVFYRVPKPNHENLVKVMIRLKDFIRKENVQYDCFSLLGAEIVPGFINITKIIQINPDYEEIWVNMVTYRDRKHRLEVVDKISNDRECNHIYEELISLITPDTGFISGEFTNLFK